MGSASEILSRNRDRGGGAQLPPPPPGVPRGSTTSQLKGDQARVQAPACCPRWCWYQQLHRISQRFWKVNPVLRFENLCFCCSGFLPVIICVFSFVSCTSRLHTIQCSHPCHPDKTGH